MKLGNSGYGYSSIVVITILPPCPALPFPAAWCATIVRHCLSFPLAPSQGQRGGGGGTDSLASFGFQGSVRRGATRLRRRINVRKIIPRDGLARPESPDPHPRRLLCPIPASPSLFLPPPPRWRIHHREVDLPSSEFDIHCFHYAFVCRCRCR